MAQFSKNLCIHDFVRERKTNKEEEKKRYTIIVVQKCKH